MDINKIFINRFVFFFVLLTLALTLLNFFLLDGLMGIVGRINAQDSTICSERYSDWKYRFVHSGMVKDDVISMLGEPLFETWEYDNIDNDNNYFMLYMDNDIVKSFAKSLYFREGSISLKNLVGKNKNYILKMFGNPNIIIMNFCSKNDNTSFKVRTVEIQKGKVLKKEHYYYID